MDENRFNGENQFLKCPKCGYIVEYLSESTCPECGTAFDPRVLKNRLEALYERRAFWTSLPRVLRILVHLRNYSASVVVLIFVVIALLAAVFHLLLTKQ